VLIDHFLQKHAKRLAIPEKRITPDVLKVLVEYSWPGNARELENCLERALVLSPGDEVELQSLPRHIIEPRQRSEGSFSEPEETSLSIKERTTNLEIDLIKRALAETRGNRTHAAKILEISHRTLLYKLKEYGLE
jgi:two-component system response regulator AtoC